MSNIQYRACTTDDIDAVLASEEATGVVGGVGGATVT